jgi:hypothetical protein
LQSFFDKWGMPALAVIIGSIIIWGLFFSPRRADDAPKAKAGVAGAR